MLLGPTLLHVNEFGTAETRPTVPQLSEPLAKICAGVMLAWPVLSSATVMFWHETLGGVVSCTVTVAWQVDWLPWPALAGRVTRLAPGVLQGEELGNTVIRFSTPPV